MKYLFLLLGLFLITACGDIPKPYQTRDLETKLNNPLLQQNNAVGIILDFPHTEFNDQELDFIAHLTTALENLNVPVWRSYVNQSIPVDSLVGTYRKKTDKIIFNWRLNNENTHNESMIDITADHNIMQLNKHLALHVAQSVAKKIKPSTMEALQKEEDLLNLSFYLTPLENAPGDGNIVLPHHLKKLLIKTGFNITDQPDTAQFILKGQIDLKSLSQISKQQIILKWYLYDKNAKEIMKITQKNQIPHGAFDLHWGEAAYWVAAGVVQEAAKSIDTYLKP